MTTKKELNAMKKTELAARAKELGLVTEGLKKKDLIDCIYEIESTGKGKACNSMYAKGLEVSKVFLQRRGFEILEQEKHGFAFIAIDDEMDAIAFIELAVREGGFPVEGAVSNRQRIDYENRIADFLADYDGPEMGITVHKLCINVLSNNRAMMRMYRNALAPGNK